MGLWIELGLLNEAKEIETGDNQGPLGIEIPKLESTEHCAPHLQVNILIEAY